MTFKKPINLKRGDLVWVRIISAYHDDVGPPDPFSRNVLLIFPSGDIIAKRLEQRPKYYYKNEVYARGTGSYNRLKNRIINSTKILRNLK